MWSKVHPRCSKRDITSSLRHYSDLDGFVSLGRDEHGALHFAGIGNGLLRAAATQNSSAQGCGVDLTAVDPEIVAAFTWEADTVGAEVSFIYFPVVPNLFDDVLHEGLFEA